MGSTEIINIVQPPITATPPQRHFFGPGERCVRSLCSYLILILSLAAVKYVLLIMVKVWKLDLDQLYRYKGAILPPF